MVELADVVSASWPPLDGADRETRETCVFRIASLLGSRAPAKAVSDELARIRFDLGAQARPLEDTRAAHAIAAWFDEATRA
jgi:hypothetical protein